ncbi:MAG: hypothetical protein VW455_00760 [Nitrospinota bacterium]
MSLKRVIDIEEPGELDSHTIVLIDHLCAFSLFPLLKICFKNRPVKIFYFEASNLGLGWAYFLKLLQLVSANPSPIKDYILTDEPLNGVSEVRFHAYKACINYQSKIKERISRYFPKIESRFLDIYETGVRKIWQLWLEEVIFQRDLGKFICQNSNISPSQVILVSKYAYLLNLVGLNSNTSTEIKVLPQTFKFDTFKYLFGPVILSSLQLISSLYKLLPFSGKESTQEAKDNSYIGVAAAWGIEGNENNRVNDFFWWRLSQVPPNRLLYMFERQDCQPTKERVSELNRLGINFTVLNKNFSGEASHSNIFSPDTSVADNLRMVFFYSSLALRFLLGDKFIYSIVPLVGWQIFNSDKLSNTYKGLKLSCLFNFDEAGFEHVNLASQKNGLVRFGVHWSCYMNPHHSTVRCHEVLFVWGNHNLKIILDSNSNNKIILFSGCFLTESVYKNEHLKGIKAVQAMKDKRVRYTLTLFDNSLPVPNFYEFFLNWLIDDPALGLIIKSKGKAWKNYFNEETKELIQRAHDTGRIYVMDKDASPIDAAQLTDFSVGATGVSAIAVAGLQGARVLYLDFEQLDQGIIKPYTLFHSLGPNRCVFYDPDSMKNALIEYFNNPESNPNLGDVSPILDQLDPFRDGKAGQRIGEFVNWYLEGLDQNLSKNDALKSATNKYAEKWGNDKVAKRL